jgi:hypothetical protein
MDLRWGRPLAAAAALLLAGGSLLQCRGEHAARARDAALWESSGATARHPQAALRAARDPDPAASRIELARALLADASDLRALASLPREEAIAGAQRAQEGLRVAEQASVTTLRQRPTSAEAAMVLGGVRLLTAARSPGGAPYRALEQWRAPLAGAMGLAPGDPEPARLLLAGTLASWYALPDDERATTRALLRRSFTDRATLAQLLPAWAAVAPDDRELTAVLPREAYAYQLLQEERARQHDWPGFCSARARWQPLLVADLERDLAAAEARLAGGDLAGGRSALQHVIADAPPDRRTASLLARAVVDLPPGPLSPSLVGALDRWLLWGLPLWELGESALSEEALARIAGSGELAPEHAALAALAAGDLERAGVWERRADRAWSEEWAPYATAKADALLQRGDVEAAAETLRNVHRMYQTRWPYLHARERLAQARHDGTAESPMQALGASDWPASAWLYSGSDTSLELVADVPGNGLHVAIDGAPAEGSVAELSLDGATVSCTPVVAGAVVRVPVTVTPGPHLLRLRPLAPGRLAPGRVILDARAG